MPAPTMTAVAKRAGVSVSTVSHVVNGTRPVNPETRERVLRAMTDLGFRHRPIVGSLGAGATPGIGLALSLSADPGLRELVDGIEAEAHRRGMQMLLVDTHAEAQHEERAVAYLLAHHVAGVLLVPVDGGRGPAVRLLQERSMPYVVVDRSTDLPADHVVVDEEPAARTLVEHLIQRGHRRIGFVGGGPQHRAGYLAAHAEHDVCFDLALDLSTARSEGDAERAVQALLSGPDAPTAFFSGGYAATVGILRAAHGLGRRVPEDVALVAFDEVPWAGTGGPEVTVLAQPWYAVGARAVQLLARRLDQPTTPPQMLRLAGDLVHRGSCGCVPGGAGFELAGG